METLHIIVEKTDSGFSAYIDQVPGCITVGESLSEIKKNMKEALELHLEGMIAEKEEFPKVLSGKYRMEIQLDVKQLFTYFKELNASAIAKRISMNDSLLRQYIIGKKSPSEKQSMRILSGVRDFGRDLVALG
jgi:predicted RNase H-like HicB family nuclease